MDKPSLRRPASERRPARRSLVELTAVASRAVADDLQASPPGPIALAIERAAKPQAIDEARLAPPEAADAAASESVRLSASDSSADMVAKIAKEFQARALERFRLSMNAAMDYAKGLVETPLPSRGAPNGERAAKPEDQIRSGHRAAAQYRAESFELFKVNLETALEYACELAHTRTPAEFVELSSEQARKQCEYVLKQSGALKSLVQAVTKSDPG